MRAELEIGCEDPELIVKSIRPDLSESERFTANLKAVKGAVKLSVEAEDAGALLAGINSYMRLIRTALDADDLEE